MTKPSIYWKGWKGIFITISSILLPVLIFYLIVGGK